MEFISTVGFQVVNKNHIEKKEITESPAPAPQNSEGPDLPVNWAEQPDVMALAGIWEGEEIDPEKLRKQAWGIN